MCRQACLLWIGQRRLLTETPDHNLYKPTDAASFFTRARRAVVARCIVYSFLTSFMTGEGSTNGWTAIDDSTVQAYTPQSTTPFKHAPRLTRTSS